MLEAQLTTILEQQQWTSLIPFLQALDDAQKKQLTPLIKELSKKFFIHEQVRSGGSYVYKQVATETQKNILYISALVCMNRTDFEKTVLHPGDVMQEKYLMPVLDWYCPAWFNDLVNKLAEKGNLYHLSYDLLIKMAEKGAVQPSMLMVVSYLTNYILEYTNGTAYFRPEKLEKYSATLQEHIWYFFEMESGIQWFGRYVNFGTPATPVTYSWIDVFKKYVDEKKIDRQRLLKESLLATSKNFNKTLSGWFVDLFEVLEPTKEELIGLQAELFSVLNAQHSKSVNNGLKGIKEIMTEKEFNASSFLDAVQMLLASNVKATVSAVLIIMEKIAHKNPKQRERICQLATQVFIQSNEELQSKAAKIIAKYGDKENLALKQEIAGFQSNILTTAKQLLAEFLEEGINPASNAPQEEETVNTDTAFTLPTEIQFPQNIEDLVFLASQAFDNNEPWHMDVVAAALVKYCADLKDEDLPRFEPAFQRAIGIARNGLRSNNGYLDHLLALFFVDIGHWMMKSFPASAAGVETVFRKYDHKDGDINRSWMVIPENSTYTAEWTTYRKVTAYEPYKLLLLSILEKIKTGNALPVLSTPDHTNGWIKPATLIDRLRTYQQAGQQPSDMDLQIAVSRCYVKNTGDGLDYARQQLTGELRELMIFLLDEKAAPKSPFHHKGAWMVASLTRKEKKQWKEFESWSNYARHFKNYTGRLEWKTEEEEYRYPVYNPELRKTEDTTRTRKILRVHKDTTKENRIKNILVGLISSDRENPLMLYDLLVIKSTYLDYEHNDIKRLLSLVPGNPAPLLVDIINMVLNDLSYLSESDKKLLTATLQVLYETWDEPGEMDYLLLGCCMLAGDKTVANTAGEIWLKAVQAGKMDNVRLGKVIGLQERIEFAPMKRLTDLLSQNLFRVSALHNRALQELVAHILRELSNEPVKNLKKLLEIYAELYTINNSKTVNDPQLLAKLNTWAQTDSLKKVIRTISPASTGSA